MKMHIKTYAVKVIKDLGKAQKKDIVDGITELYEIHRDMPLKTFVNFMASAGWITNELKTEGVLDNNGLHRGDARWWVI